jgi:tubulin beta
MMCAADPRHGKYLTAATLYRGRLSTQDCENQLVNIMAKNSSYFAEWIPNNTKISVCDVAPAGLPMAGTFLGNNTSI